MNNYHHLFRTWQIRISSFLKLTLNILTLHLKKAGKYWSARVGRKHRTLAVEIDEGLIWFWIGTHPEYDRLLRELA